MLLAQRRVIFSADWYWFDIVLLFGFRKKAYLGIFLGKI
jgi:hypothetical protein